MSSSKTKYVVGQTIFCHTTTESCLVIDINYSYGFYIVKWLLKMPNQIYDDRVSFFVAHKYFKPIEKVKKNELSTAR